MRTKRQPGIALSDEQIDVWMGVLSAKKTALPSTDTVPIVLFCGILIVVRARINFQLAKDCESSENPPKESGGSLTLCCCALILRQQLRNQT